MYEITDLTPERTELTKAEKARLAGEKWTAEIKRCYCTTHEYFDQAIYYLDGRRVGPAVYCPRCFNAELSTENRAFLPAAERAKLSANLVGVPERSRGITLDELQLSDDYRADIDRFINGDLRNLIILGDIGTGKTLTVSAIGQALAEKGQTVRYITEYDLMSKLKTGISSGKDMDDFLDMLYNVDLFVVDEVGDSKGSEFKSSVYKNIVDKRWSNHRRQTIFVSNLEAKQLAEEVGMAAIDRLTDCGSVLVYRGKSRRGELQY